MSFTFESIERIFLRQIQNLELFTTRPTDPPAYGPINVVRNRFLETIPPEGGPGAIEQVYRFQILEIDIYFPGGSGQITVVPFLSRTNPAGVEAGGSGGEGDQGTDVADSWGSFGPQTAYADPLTAAGGNRIRIAAGGAELLALCAQAGGTHCNAMVYGIAERRGGIS